MFYQTKAGDLINLHQTCRISRTELKKPLADRFRLSFMLVNGEVVEEAFRTEKERDTAFAGLMFILTGGEDEDDE